MNSENKSRPRYRTRQFDARVSFPITSDLRKSLEEESGKEKRSMASLAREAIADLSPGSVTVGGGQKQKPAAHSRHGRTFQEAQGRNMISPQRLELFNESSLPEAITLHANQPGFFSVLVLRAASKPRQRSYRVDLLPQVLAALDATLDSYISQATFFKPNRRLVNLWHLPLCFVDLDAYKTEYASADPAGLSLAVRQHLADTGIPPASMVIHSGQGLYLKWLLKSPLPQSKLPQWNVVQRELINKLADFGADPKAKDASRVLRLVSTCNTKQHDPVLRKVRVLWVEEEDGDPLLHDFEQLADAVLPFTRKEEEIPDAGRPPGRILQFKQFKKGVEAEKQAHRFSYQSLHWTRVADMRTLQTLRGPIAEGERETFVFLMLNELAKSGQVNARNFPYETAALARECDSFIEGTDWSMSTFRTLYRRVPGAHGR